MRKLTYINSLGAELVLTDTAPFILKLLTDDNSVNIYNNKGMLQNGSTYLGNTLDVRTISIEVQIVGNAENEIISYRNMINNVFNPLLGEGWLIYKDDMKEIKIKCIPNKLPAFATVFKNRLNKCLISLTASNPFWQDIEEIRTEIALWIGDFEFPFEIPADGFEFGHRSINQIPHYIFSSIV